MSLADNKGSDFCPTENTSPFLPVATELTKFYEWLHAFHCLEQQRMNQPVTILKRNMKPDCLDLHLFLEMEHNEKKKILCTVSSAHH